MRTFIRISSPHIISLNLTPQIMDLARKMLKPETNEATAVFIGNFIIQIFKNLSPKIDTDILMGIIEKLYKCRIPSIVQSLIIVYARLVHSNLKPIVGFLSETSHNNRISLKILLDKWLLHQPLFRGKYVKNTTFSALLKLVEAKNEHIDSLMVVGYDPSHKNVNSEVRTPFKILSTVLRMIENETKIEKKLARQGEKKETKEY